MKRDWNCQVTYLSMKFSISSSFNPCGTNIEPMQLVKKHFVLDLDIGFG